MASSRITLRESSGIKVWFSWGTSSGGILPLKKDFPFKAHFLTTSIFDACPNKLVRPLSSASTFKRQHTACTRRSGNYPSSLWDDGYIQALTSLYSEEIHNTRLEELKNEVILMMQKVMDPLEQLKLIDNLRRLGLSYHFKDIIEMTLRNCYTKFNGGHQWKDEDDLYATALLFRLFRDYGFHISQEVFGKFKDDSGDFKPCLETDTNGLLSLYEASFLSIEGETMLDHAKDFSTKHLVGNLLNENMDHLLAMQVRNALETPLHWRMMRNHSRWFIKLYEQNPEKNPILLEFAKLDFNCVQSTHLNDLKIASRWWKKTGLAEKLPFSRDRLAECFFWSVGVTFEPQHGYCRQMLTRVFALATTIDDVYDVYGTLEELELFTYVVERWDVNMIDRLPDYMKICFLTLFNSVNEMGYDSLKENGFDGILHMKIEWARFCKSCLVEAKWHQSGYKPSLDEYLTNAIISIGGLVVFNHVCILLSKQLTNDGLHHLVTSLTPLAQCSSMIVRLTNDLGTSTEELKRGDVPKAIQCYMNDSGATEEESRAYIANILISKTWMKMNEARFRENCHCSNTLFGAVINLARMSQLIYQYGDGHGVSHSFTKDLLLKLLIEPIL